MATLFGMFPFLKTLFADSGYQGPKFAKALAKVLPHLDIEIVKRSDQVSGFVVERPNRMLEQVDITSESGRNCRLQGTLARNDPYCFVEPRQRVGGVKLCIAKFSVSK